MRWELRRGRALDIWSTGEYPADVLSNLCSNRFRLDGIECQSMEGFLQSFKMVFNQLKKKLIRTYDHMRVMSKAGDLQSRNHESTPAI